MHVKPLSVLLGCAWAAWSPLALAGGVTNWAGTFEPAEFTGRGCVGDRQGPSAVNLLLDAGGSSGYIELWGFNVYRLERSADRELRLVLPGAGASGNEAGSLWIPARPASTIETDRAKLRVRSVESDCEYAGELRVSPASTAEPEEVWRRAAVAAEIQADGLAVRSLEVAGKDQEALARAQGLTARAEESLGSRNANYGHALRRQASVLWSKGRYEEAAGVSERAVSVLRETLGAEALESAHAVNDLGLIYRDSGRHADALPLLVEGLSAAERGLGAQHLQSARLLFNLSLVREDLYRFEEALPGFERVYMIRVQALGEDDRATLRTREAIANTLRKIGRVQEAAQIQEQTCQAYLERFGPNDVSTIAAQALLGSMLAWAGQTERALALEKDAAEALESRLGLWHWYTMQAFAGYVGSLILAGQLDEADRLLSSRADAAFAASGVSPDFLYRLHNLRARLHVERRQWSEAESSFARAAEIAARTRSDEHPLVIAVQSQRARYLAELGRREEAIHLLERWLDSTEKARASGGFGESNRQALLAGRHREYRELAALYASAGRSADSFRTSELLKARSLLDTLATRSALQAAGMRPEEADRLAGLGLRIAKLDDRLSRLPHASSERLLLEAQRSEAEREVMQLRRALIQRSPKAKAITQLDIVDPPAAQRLLRPDEAAISYLYGDKRVFAFVVTRSRPLAMFDLGDAAPLRGAVEALSTLLASPASGEPVWRLQDGRFTRSATRPDATATEVHDWRDPASALGDFLVRPLLPSLRGHATWFVAPDAILAEIPLDALIVDSRTIAASRSVVNVQSLSVLAAIRSRNAPGAAGHARTLLAVGAPEYAPPQGAAGPPTENWPAGAPGSPVRGAAIPVGVSLNRSPARTYEEMGIRWDALPGSREEALAVSAAFERAGTPSSRAATRVLLGLDASEATLQRLDRSGELGSYRYLHFATHGYLNPDVPALSAVVLSTAAPTPEADGYVTAAEWTGYTLNSELIVLSACETGRGQHLPGEGVLGLPYAMFVAGNRAAVLTLWKVDDQSSSRFVSAFFQRVSKGVPPSQALAATKREFARSRRYAHPFHWAGFVMYGG